VNHLRLDLRFHAPLRLYQLPPGILDADVRQIGMRHRVRTDQMSMLRQSAHLLPRHHELARVRGQPHRQIGLDLADHALLFRARKSRHPVAGGEISRVPLALAAQRPNLRSLVFPFLPVCLAK